MFEEIFVQIGWWIETIHVIDVAISYVFQGKVQKDLKQGTDIQVHIQSMPLPQGKVVLVLVPWQVAQDVKRLADPLAEWPKSVVQFLAKAMSFLISRVIDLRRKGQDPWKGRDASKIDRGDVPRHWIGTGRKNLSFLSCCC